MQYNDHWNELLFNSVSFTENGNDVFVDIEQMKTALNNGADVNWIQTNSIRPKTVLSNFIETFSAGENSYELMINESGVKAVNMLFKHGAKIQNADSKILFWPVALGHYNLTKILIEKGIDAKSWPANIGTKLTPIEFAAVEAHNNIVELLSEYGARIRNEKDIIQAQFVRVAAWGSLEKLEILLKKGAYINGMHKDGYTALISAVSGPYTDPHLLLRVSFLLKNGANTNQLGKGRLTHAHGYPLHFAIRFASFRFKNDNIDKRTGEGLITLLLNHGAYVSSRDITGMTPLHVAAKYNNIYAADMLLKKGSKVMPKDNEDKTPLDYAESSEMIKLLMQYGAKEY